VCPVKSEDRPDPEALRNCDDADVRRTERQAAVLVDEVGGSAAQILRGEVTRSKVPTATERRNAASAAAVARVERK
jgi:hypothetical protein